MSVTRCLRFLKILKPFGVHEQPKIDIISSKQRFYTVIANATAFALGVSIPIIPMQYFSYKKDFNRPVIHLPEDKYTYIGGAVRFVRSLKIAFVISLDYTFSSLGLIKGHKNYEVMIGRIHQRAADRLLKGCLQNGGTYIKLGQGLCVMNHVLPIEYVTTLRQLQDECLKKDWKEVGKLFMEDFGQTPEEIYQSINPVSIAAASLAQVFVATTKDGQKVAVKVQYYDLQRRFKSDVAIVEFILNIIGFVHKSFNFAWILHELRYSLAQELDFRTEAKNAERCAKELQHLSYIYIPEVVWGLCSSRVLVTEFIDAYKLSETSKLEKNGFSLADIDTKMFEAFGTQIFQTGFIHADPHPGNILIRKNKGQTELVLLDHGLYETISKETCLSLSHVWRAIVVGDSKEMKKYSRDLGVEDYEMFAEILTQIPLKHVNFKLTHKLTEADIEHIQMFARTRFDQIMKVLRAMPSSLLLVLRNLNTIRAIALEHGNPIDRFQLLSRIATRQIFASELSIARLYFECKLSVYKLQRFVSRTVLRIFKFFVRSAAAQEMITRLVHFL